jgi:hypothetical protein
MHTFQHFKNREKNEAKLKHGITKRAAFVSDRPLLSRQKSEEGSAATSATAVQVEDLKYREV